MKTPISRRIFFWTLFVSYFVITALVLFFVFGYRHDFGQKVFVHTGSLTIKTNPKEVTIKIDGKVPGARLINVINDSYFISGLRPKKHDVSITRDGFKQWHKEVNIHSGMSTEFWNVLLIANEYERTEFDIENIDNFFPAPKENIFAATKQLGKTLVVTVFDIEQNNSINSFILPHKTFTQNKNENIEWSPTSKEMIIPVINNDTERNDYSIAYTQTNESVLISDIIVDENIRSMRWDPEKKNSIYFLSNNSLMKVGIPTPNTVLTKVKMLDDVVAYDFSDDGIYILKIDGSIMYSSDKKNLSNMKKLALFDIDKSHMEYRLISYDKHRIVVLDDKNNDLYIYNDADKDVYIQKISQNILGAHFSDDGKKLLYYSPFEIFVYITRDLDSQPIRLENQTQSLVRFSKQLTNVHFAKDYEHIIFTVDKSIKITELDYRGNRITRTIIDLNEVDSKLINKHKINKLLFIDSTDTADRQLQMIEFPVKETLF